MSPPIPFRFEIVDASPAYLVVTTDSLMGQCHETVKLPPPEPLDPARLRETGESLYHAVFAGDLRSHLYGVRQEAHRQGSRVAFELRFGERAVAAALRPWELLHDGQQFLLLSGLDLYRFITFSQAVRPVSVTGRLRVALVASSPRNLTPLAVHGLAEPLTEMPGVEVDQVVPPTYDGLLDRLSPYRPAPQVFDFEGHGGWEDDQLGLFFETEDGDSHFISADALGVALSDRRVALAVLNACHGGDVDGTALFNGVAPALVLAGVPAVIGMQGRISDDAANRFVRVLYEGIGHGLPATVAVSEARRRLYLNHEWYKPVLYLRSTDPEGRILESRTEAGEPVGDPQDPGGAAEDPAQGRRAQLKLFEVLDEKFSEDDFGSLCWSLGVQPAELKGGVLSRRKQSLIDFMENRDRLPELIRKVIEKRPKTRAFLLGGE